MKSCLRYRLAIDVQKRYEGDFDSSTIFEPVLFEDIRSGNAFLPCLQIVSSNFYATIIRNAYSSSHLACIMDNYRVCFVDRYSLHKDDKEILFHAQTGKYESYLITSPELMTRISQINSLYEKLIQV